MLTLGVAALLGIVAAPPPGAVDPDVIQRGRRRCHEIALTFDLCPVHGGSGFDAGLVEDLVQSHTPATFFASGRWMIEHEAALRALLAVSFFEVETHGQRHAHLKGMDADAQRREIEGPVGLLRARYDHESLFFRPPYGDYDETTLAVARGLGLRLVLWSAASGDPDPRLSEADIMTALGDRLRDGSVIVFHANGKGWHTRDVIRDLHGPLAERHLQPVTLATLLQGCS